jgi:hypothetical protein
MWFKSTWTYLLYGLLFGQKVSAIDLQIDDEREFLFLFSARLSDGD